MSKFSERFNALPDESRFIAADLMLETEIRNLKLECERLNRRYEASRSEINEKIKYCERELSKRLLILNSQSK